MNRVLAIDLTNLFIINYTANPSLDLNGQPIGGIVGTLLSLRKAIKDLKPTKIVCAWDGYGGSAKRREIYKGYKDGRKPAVIAGRYYQYDTEDNAKKNATWQIKTLQSLMSNLPICQIQVEHTEADDVISYISKHYEYFNHDTTVIVSCDKDFYQLINERTYVYNPMSKKLWTEEDVLKEFNIHPSNWLFCKAICGDNSDNVKGVKGVGFKTVAKLFDTANPTSNLKIETLAEAVETADEKKKPKYQKIAEHKEIIELNWKIMSLDDALMSAYSKDKISSTLQNYKPSLLKTKFYLDVMKLGGLNLPSGFFDPFVALAVSK